MSAVPSRERDWSDWELQVLYDRVHDLDWFSGVCDLLPSRTPAAIRSKMAKLRDEAEIVPRGASPRTIRRYVERGSERLAKAENELRMARCWAGRR